MGKETNRIEIKLSKDYPHKIPLSQILDKCKAAGWDLDKVKIETEIWEDFSTCEEFVKLFIKYNKK